MLYRGIGGVGEGCNAHPLKVQRNYNYSKVLRPLCVAMAVAMIASHSDDIADE